MARRHDDRQSDRGDGQGAAVPRCHQRLDDADQGAHRHAGDRHPHARRGQGDRPRPSQHGGVARQVETRSQTVPGTSSAYAERVIGGYYLEIIPDRGARPLRPDDLRRAGRRRDGARRRAHHDHRRGPRTLYSRVRYPRDFAPIRRPLRRTSRVDQAGGTVPLGEVADINLRRGRPSIRTENAKLATYVFVDFRGRDLGGYVADASRRSQRRSIAARHLPVWSGQFEYLERAEARCRWSCR